MFNEDYEKEKELKARLVELLAREEIYWRDNIGKYGLLLGTIT